MLGTILAIIVYGAIILGFIDVFLYIAVKIKERKNKKNLTDIKKSVIDADLKNLQNQKK